ncbi:hypothetical protein B0T16DRAFT_234495 [Cercophora newfieldiana]|uniref:Uncharacterized protein n=1 Tax=Cercophora newfieldiana TaxID=92897 RepID=A0AA40CHD5_9PEZI|nr:hypothetical protein B0T16DRAFT_234495 [Cercophora newfieldiana]
MSYSKSPLRKATSSPLLSSPTRPDQTNRRPPCGPTHANNPPISRHVSNQDLHPFVIYLSQPHPTNHNDNPITISISISDQTKSTYHPSIHPLISHTKHPSMSAPSYRVTPPSLLPRQPPKWKSN